MSNVLKEVQNHWEKQSCGTHASESEKFTLDYYEEIEEFRYRHEPFIHEFAQFTRWRGKQVLEVGVGAGSDFLQFIRAGAIADGIDLTEEGIQNTQNRLKVYDLKERQLEKTSAEKLPFPDNVYDLVYSWGVIHHTDDTEKAFNEIVRVTKPGGRVKIMLYNRSSLHTWYMFLRYALPKGKIFGGRNWAVYHHQESYATKVFTEADVRRMLTDTQYKDLRFSYWDQRIRQGAKFEKIRRFLQRICPRKMRWYMAFEFTKV